MGVGTWGDEPYGASTALRYHLGDRPLVDSWDTNFSSAVMLSPLVGLWLELTGSTDGLLLGLRSGYAIMALLMAACSYRLLRLRALGLVGSLFSAGMILYLPFLSPFLGYGADWQLHILSALSAALLHDRILERPHLALLPGVLSGLAIVGNPPTALVLPAFAGAFALADRSGAPDTPQRSAWWYLAGAMLVGVGFLLALRMMAGPGMLSLIEHVAQPDDHAFDIASQIQRAWEGRWLVAMSAGLGVMIGAMSRRLSALGPLSLLASSMGLSTLGVVFLAATHRLPIVTLPQSLAFVAGAASLIALLLAGRLPSDRRLAFLTLPCLGAGAGWFLGSNAGVYSAVVTAPLLLLAAILWADDTADTATDHSNDKTSRVSLAFAVTLSALLLVWMGTGLYYTPEGRTPAMRATVTSGPFAGIKGTEEEVLFQQRVVAALRALPPAQGRVAYLERFSLGYLITPERPGTYSTWATAAGSNRLQQYVDATENRPLRVVLTRYAIDMRDGEFPETVNLRGFPELFREIYRDDDLVVYDAAP